MIPPDRIPANTPRDNIVIVQSAKILDMAMLTYAVASSTRLAMVNQLLQEALRDVPGADFIEIRAIRYDVKEEPDERAAQPAPDAE